MAVLKITLNKHKTEHELEKYGRKHWWSNLFTQIAQQIV